MIKILVDTNIVDKLIELPPNLLNKIISKYQLLTTDINVIELIRIKDTDKRTRALTFVDKYLKVIPAKVFCLPAYEDKIIEDSVAGFSTADEPNNGTVLTYDDAVIIANVGQEINKIKNGTAMNDFAFAVQVSRNQSFISITNDNNLKKKLNKSNCQTISWKEILNKL